MSINQKNLFGDNIINEFNAIFSRALTDEVKTELLRILAELSSKSVTIRYEQSGETQEFSQLLCEFLSRNGYRVVLQAVMMSEIKRQEFSIEKHPTENDWSIIKIGTLN